MATEITNEQQSMIRYWQTMTPKIKPEELVANLTRRYKMATGTAWIIVARLRNEEHTRRTA